MIIVILLHLGSNPYPWPLQQYCFVEYFYYSDLNECSSTTLSPFYSNLLKSQGPWDWGGGSVYICLAYGRTSPDLIPGTTPHKSSFLPKHIALNVAGEVGNQWIICYSEFSLLKASTPTRFYRICSFNCRILFMDFQGHILNWLY